MMINQTRTPWHKLVWVFLTGIGTLIALTGCQPTCNKMEPIIVYTPPQNCINERPSAFPALSDEECQEEWAKELMIGDHFARELDLYRAITAYKRAIILLPESAVERRLQLDYDLILCYYLGQKYQEATNLFEESQLIEANPLFPAFSNLLLILYDSYQQTQQPEKAERILEIIEKASPETASDLLLFSALKEGDLTEIETIICNHPKQETLQDSLNTYYTYAKSPSKARQLNAILPGAGYYYIGQKKSALTSFLINTLFTAAAYQFFQHGYLAAGLITTSLELGWYLGGINGAGLEAEEFNTRLYEGVGKKIMSENNLFPLLMLETTF